MIKKRKNSFTLVEILVVITIIAIVAGVIIVSTQASRELARDKKRMGDFAAYQTALMQYYSYSQDKVFPGPVIGEGMNDNAKRDACQAFCGESTEGFVYDQADNLCTCHNIDCLGELVGGNAQEQGFLPNILKDPLNEVKEGIPYAYNYIVTLDRKDFKLTVPLERDQQAMENDGGVCPDECPGGYALYEVFSTMGAFLAVRGMGMGIGEFIDPVLGGLSCQIVSSPTCDEGEKVLGVSALTNAHVAIATNNDYNYSLCCQAGNFDVSITDSCTSNCSHCVSLSGETDAHISSNIDHYKEKACIELISPAIGNIPITCTVGSDCDSEGYVPLFTLSGATNAHVAEIDKDDSYSNKFCCKASNQ